MQRNVGYESLMESFQPQKKRNDEWNSRIIIIFVAIVVVVVVNVSIVVVNVSIGVVIISSDVVVVVVVSSDVVIVAIVAQDGHDDIRRFTRRRIGLRPRTGEAQRVIGSLGRVVRRLHVGPDGLDDVLAGRSSRLGSMRGVAFKAFDWCQWNWFLVNCVHCGFTDRIRKDASRQGGPNRPMYRPMGRFAQFWSLLEFEDAERRSRYDFQAWYGWKNLALFLIVRTPSTNLQFEALLERSERQIVSFHQLLPWLQDDCKSVVKAMKHGCLDGLSGS